MDILTSNEVSLEYTYKSLISNDKKIEQKLTEFLAARRGEESLRNIRELNFSGPEHFYDYILDLEAKINEDSQ